MDNVNRSTDDQFGPLCVHGLPVHMPSTCPSCHAAELRTRGCHMTIESQLAPCPFCGRSDTLTIGTTHEMHEEDCACYLGEADFAVFCDASSDNNKGGCGASAGVAPTEAEAAERWNRRAT